VQTEPINEYQIAGQLEIIFGSRTAAYVLLYIQSRSSAYAAQIANTFGVRITAVQQQLRKFENEGVLVSYTVGRTRVFEFNPRGATVRNLQQFLSNELEFMASENSGIPNEVYRQYFSHRQRPRRTGKSLDLVPEELRK
jgi:predicted ArsR family transcriptional regulator